MKALTAVFILFFFHGNALALKIFKTEEQKIYTCSDKHGNIYFTNNPEYVPPSCRKRLKEAKLPLITVLHYKTSEGNVLKKVKRAFTDMMAEMKKIIGDELPEKKARKAKREINSAFGIENDIPYMKLTRLSRFLEEHPEIKKKILKILKRKFPPEALKNPFYSELFKEVED